MKNHIVSLFRLAIVTLAAYPAFVLAAPTAGSAYYTDEANSYVQDQTSQTMSSLNNILCFMGAMAPDLMVNLTTNSGNYIALVNENTCGKGGGGGGQSSNTGPKYTSVVVNSSRASSTDPMIVKAWVGMPPMMDIAVYASATQAPSAAGATPYLPYGVFRMDYCGTATGGAACAVDKGFINATSTGGLSFYSGSSFSGFTDTTALQLSATSASAGSGAITNTNDWTGSVVTTTFTFAYNANYFVRNDGPGDNKCFNRDPLVADESVWRYGLYDATTGAQISRKSGFPIEYTAAGVTSNGYIGYYGMWMQVTVNSGETVNQVSYDTNPPTKTAYTLLKTGGKLMKFTTATKNLSALNKVTFWYYAPTTITVTGSTSITSMTPGQYELYWDDTAGYFKVSGKQNTTTYNMEPLAIHGSVANAAMIAANPWGLFGWSQMMGGMFGIKGSDFASLSSTTPVVTQTQDVVYPHQYAAINTAGGLKCINDCPTVALIAASNATTPTSTTPFTNLGWTPVAEASFIPYTLNAATGNLEASATAVVSTATSGTNANGIRSGRMVTPADATAMIAAKTAAGILCSGSPCTTFNQGDVDFLPVGSSYYVWETGGQPWNQIALLMNGSTPVQFEAPLQVNFTVPSGAKYGNYAGATMSLQYGGFGDLWGIPNECVDITTNTSCVFGTTLQQNQRWTSLFSIPFDATAGKVTVATTQGTVAAGTEYLVKALDKEVRLKNELTSVCTTAGLTAPAFSSITLPAGGDWSDPTAAGKTPVAKPTFTTVPAPQVIHGVKQY